SFLTFTLASSLGPQNPHTVTESPFLNAGLGDEVGLEKVTSNLAAYWLVPPGGAPKLVLPRYFTFSALPVLSVGGLFSGSNFALSISNVRGRGELLLIIVGVAFPVVTTITSAFCAKSMYPMLRPEAR